MQQYLLSIYQPDGPMPSPEALGKVMQDVFAWEQELKDAGAWVFTAGLHPASTATVVRLKEGEMLTTDGPYTEGKEHLGGFNVIQAEDLDAALEWARKLSSCLHIPSGDPNERITSLPVEVRPVQFGGGH